MDGSGDHRLVLKQEPTDGTDHHPHSSERAHHLSADHAPHETSTTENDDDDDSDSESGSDSDDSGSNSDHSSGSSASSKSAESNASSKKSADGTSEHSDASPSQTPAERSVSLFTFLFTSDSASSEPFEHVSRAPDPKWTVMRRMTWQMTSIPAAGRNV
jgi:hypothetical protein